MSANKTYLRNVIEVCPAGVNGLTGYFSGADEISRHCSGSGCLRATIRNRDKRRLLFIED
jgi:hypothetical protein